MSRIGNRPIDIVEGVDVKFEGNRIFVKGKLGELNLLIPDGISVEIKDGKIFVKRSNDTKKLKSLHGTIRALINNMVKGVSEGFTRQLEVVGVGYRVSLKGSNELQIEVGYSHPVFYKIPEGVSVKVEKNIIHLSSPDKQKLGQVAAEIRRIRPPEPYKGKGIRYVGEHIRRKAGKAQVGAK
ncbi:MAG: 50S ribosomal protein L6 [Caldiserica bacterium]|nr:MAG: 50S ribosomal protein L6 [Caldisericota bacterium]